MISATDANAVYEYDLGNRLTKLTNNIDDSNSITFEYSNYDNVGNRLSMKIDDADAHVYTYDSVYQLTFVDYNDSNTTSYDYDSLGNRTSVDDGSPATYLSNNLNQYTSVGGTSYSYNNNGNLTDDGLFKFYYDCENRLTDVNDQNDTAVASHSYDYAGRRISKTVYGSPDVTTKYCYEGGQVIAEYDGSDNLLRKFIYGPGIDEPICMVDVADSNAVYYYHFDGLGSVVALSDVNNVIVESYSYDVFGAPTIYDANYTEISPSAVGNPYMFTARRADDETALYYYRARYYAFDIGRFLQTDSIGYGEGMNMYSYCDNSPTNYTDPSGLCKDSLWNRWGELVRSSDALTSVGAFVIGALERVYGIEQAARHPGKTLGEWTVNTLEDIYDFEVAAYDLLYDLGYNGTSSQWYSTFYDIGSGQSTLGSDIVNIISQSDLLSADPSTAGNAWGSLTVDAEIMAVASHVRVTKVKPHSAHHSFPIIGKQPHLQTTVYLKSVDNSHFNIRLPLIE